MLNFFSSIEYLFFRLNIKSNSKFRGFFQRKDGIKTISAELYICCQKNFIEFKNNIPLTHKSKIKALECTINSYIVKPYDKYGYKRLKEIVLNKLKSSNFSTTQLTKETTIIRSSIGKHLRRIRKEGLIKEVKRLMYGEIIWSLVEEK